MTKRLTILLMLTLTVILSSSAHVAHFLPRLRQVETLRMRAFMLQRNVQLHAPHALPDAAIIFFQTMDVP